MSELLRMNMVGINGFLVRDDKILLKRINIVVIYCKIVIFGNWFIILVIMVCLLIFCIL